MGKKTSIILLVIISFFGCNIEKQTKVEPAFYYWKNKPEKLHPKEIEIVQALEIHKLYVKLFEVEKEIDFGIRPFAKTNLKHLPKAIDNIEIIPTIFIKNEVLFNSTKLDLQELVPNLIHLTEKYYSKISPQSEKSFTELQIDCDWTAKTKDNYFFLLKKLKEKSGKQISCTLRLYPYKYPKIMGVPPVDKATLMCYNLTNSLKNEHKNSIQDNNELEKYLRSTNKYPVHLDIALPIYSWTLLFQNKTFKKVISIEDLALKQYAKQVSPLWWEVQESHTVDNLYLRPGDQLKVERVTKEKTEETIALLKKYITFDEFTTLTFFHLDYKNSKLHHEDLASHFITEFGK